MTKGRPKYRKGDSPSVASAREKEKNKTQNSFRRKQLSTRHKLLAALCTWDNQNHLSIYAVTYGLHILKSWKFYIFTEKIQFTVFKTIIITMENPSVTYHDSIFLSFDFLNYISHAQYGT